ncbi:MAG: Maf family protein [archaeon]
MNKKLILASGSPRRKEMLNLFNLNLEIVPSTYEEDMSLDMHPQELVKTLALGKAQEVSKRVNGLVLGADTIVYCDNEVLGKPKDENDAIRMLKKISGKIVEVYSGIALIENENVVTDFDLTKVHMKLMTDEDIINYVKTKEPMDKAGAFAIQGAGGVLIEKIDGSESNVRGLPLAVVNKNLARFGLRLL